jgi:superfamily II DNA or RNA helicase
MSKILSKEGYLIPKNDKFAKLIDETKKELTVEPFQTFTKAEPDQFQVYQENKDYLCVPKYYGLSKFGKPDINKEINGQEININFNGSLRPLQEEIISKVVPYIKKNDGGVLCLPCAAGKTVLALYLASVFKVKTLVIVHKTFLLNQWKERAEQFTNATIGIIQRDKIDTNKDIVIGMLQSISKEKYNSEIFKDFGLVIFDEAHHAPSKYFSKALPQIASKLTIGLSATPKRNDKLEKVLFWYFGNIMYKVNTEENNSVLVNIMNYSITHEKFKEYKMYTGDINRPKTINKITSIGRRNKFIVDTILNMISTNNERKIIILSDRLEHLNLLKERINKIDEKITTDFYIGGMKQKALDNAKNAQVIFASYGMASEGLDIPELNTLFMVTSRREVEQAVGRVVRKINPDIRPIIYDFTDQLPSFINQCNHRKKLYNKMGFEIKIFEVHENVITKEIIEPKKNKLQNVDCDFID